MDHNYVQPKFYILCDAPCFVDEIERMAMIASNVFETGNENGTFRSCGVPQK